MKRTIARAALVVAIVASASISMESRALALTPFTADWPSSWVNPRTGSNGGTIGVNTLFGAYSLGCSNADRSADYTWYLPGSSTYSAHLALDLNIGAGAAVYAVGAGNVVYVGAKWGTEWATVILVEHSRADGSKFVVTYGHVDAEVAVGAVVTAGQRIATVANLASGPHLHLGLKPGTGTAEMATISDARVSGSTCGLTGNTVGMVDPIGYLGAAGPGTGDPDSDSDGVADSQDRCPSLPGSVEYNGCPGNEGSSRRSDFNGDGYDDVVSFYNYGLGDSAILYSKGGAGGLAWNGTTPWRSRGGFEWERSKVVSGDFNGDGADDLGALYNYGGSSTGFFVWPGGSGFGTTSSKIWQAASGWSWDRAKLSVGDFNGDGYDDVVSFYDYALGDSAILLTKGSATGLQWNSGTTAWRSNTGFEWARSKVMAGDFNGDGADDLGVLYNYGGSSTGFFVWPGGSGFGTTSSKIWQAASGWSWDRAKPTVGDYNGDGYDDVASLYNYAPGDSAILLTKGSASGLLWLSGTTAWRSNSGFEWANSRPSSGDFNCDGRADYGVLYDYGGSNTGFFVWPGGATGLGPTNSKIWQATSGWSWDRAKTVSGASPCRAPSVPVAPAATAGDGTATVTFSPPRSSGGPAVNGYTVTASPGGRTATGASSPITIGGLTNGVTYTFTARASNGIGTSASSAQSNAVTPVAATTESQLTGNVSVASSPPSGLPRATVRIYPAGVGSPIRLVTTDALGSWAASVPSGSYRVEVVPPSGRLRRAWAGGGTGTVINPPAGGTAAAPPVVLPAR